MISSYSQISIYLFFRDFKNLCRKYHSWVSASESIDEKQIIFLKSNSDDSDEDGIKFRDFLLAHHLSVYGNLETKLRRLFHYCDSDRDGLICHQDLLSTISMWQHVPASLETMIAKFTENNYNEDQFLQKCLDINKNCMW